MMENFVVDSKWVKENYHKEEHLVIPEGATKIEGYVFSYCSSLRSVSIPDSVTSIGDHAFSGCPLKSIEIPGSVKKIGNWAFDNCKDLESVCIEEGVTSIGEYAFSTIEHLYIHIPNSVTYMGKNAITCGSVREWTAIICEPGSYAERYARANSIPCYPEGEFIDNVWIRRNYDEQTKTVIIPETAKVIGRYAFSGIGNSKIYIPESVESIDEYARKNGFHTIVCSPNSVAERFGLQNGFKVEYAEEVERTEETNEIPTTEESAVSLRASMDKLLATVQSQQEMIASLQEQLAKVTEQMRQPSQEEKEEKPQKENAPAKTSSKDAQKGAWGDWRKRYEVKHDKTDR